MTNANQEESNIMIHNLNSWEEFIVSVRNSTFPYHRIYRGHAKIDYKLSSKWERHIISQKKYQPELNNHELYENGAYEIIRDSRLKQFKNFAIGIPGFDGKNLSNNEWWALGRHHGLITPFLDWTESPYIASFFAFTDYIGHDFMKTGKLNEGFYSTRSPIVIWSLSLAPELEIKDEFEIIKVNSEYPSRIKAQQGLFSLLTHNKFLDLESYLNNRNLSKYLERFEIPGLEWKKAIHDLDSMNINFASLFPDFTGAAMMANFNDIRA